MADQGWQEGFCVGENPNTLWCYVPANEMRPAQKACVGTNQTKMKEADAQCAYNPDGYERIGLCQERAGGMMRCMAPGQMPIEQCRGAPATPDMTTPLPPTCGAWRQNPNNPDNAEAKACWNTGSGMAPDPNNPDSEQWKKIGSSCWWTCDGITHSGTCGAHPTVALPFPWCIGTPSATTWPPPPPSTTGPQTPPPSTTWPATTVPPVVHQKDPKDACEGKEKGAFCQWEPDPSKSEIEGYCAFRKTGVCRGDVCQKLLTCVPEGDGPTDDDE